MSEKLVDVHADSVWWFCPGCESAHRIEIGRWSWNEDREAPTFTPSVLSTMTPHESMRDEVPAERCHCFVESGQIRFLNDCTHELAGQTVPIPPLPEWMQ